MGPEGRMRGPRTRPSLVASASPPSAPPASRTVVKPESRATSQTWKIRAAVTATGVRRPLRSARSTRVRWAWASMRPGTTVRPPRSSSTPVGGRPPTWAIRSPSTAITPSRTGPAPVPSTTFAPRSTRLAMRARLAGAPGALRPASRAGHALRPASRTGHENGHAVRREVEATGLDAGALVRAPGRRTIRLDDRCVLAEVAGDDDPPPPDHQAVLVLDGHDGPVQATVA